jgi:hypothetical protein
MAISIHNSHGKSLLVNGNVLDFLHAVQQRIGPEVRSK